MRPRSVTKSFSPSYSETLIGQQFERDEQLLHFSGRSAIDEIVAAAALILLAPILLIIGIAVWLEDGRPIVFRQVRVGRGGKPFLLLKFRSMYNGLPGRPLTAAGDARVTRTGRFLRKFKIDELPQLWNVMKGEMSLVGPRPEVPCYVDMEDATWREVLRVKPGITDVATLLFRDEEKRLAHFQDPEQGYKREVLPEKLALNLAYLRNRSFGRDMRLIALTVRYSFVPGSVNERRVKKLILS